MPPEYPLLRILPSQGGKDAVGYRFAKMKIDADGAPNAYHPDNIQAALDHLANAGAAIESPGAQRLIADTREKTKTWMDLFRQARANDFVGYPKFDW
ncbi:MAG TPA: hypothetical protein ENN80_02015 [Candidatus Hydrogenedentes bacterium]|nr:hypothetical protein [Candidatus Hydrogenedentota bacterium]